MRDDHWTPVSAPTASLWALETAARTRRDRPHYFRRASRAVMRFVQALRRQEPTGAVVHHELSKRLVV